MPGKYNTETIDLEMLQVLYDESVQDLNFSLLNGVPWEEIQQHRSNVSTLGIALYQRIQSGTQHPSEHASRGLHQ